MQSTAQACAQGHCGNVSHEPNEFVESEIEAALHVVCSSISHSRKVAFGVASDSTAQGYALAADEARVISSLASARRRANWRRGRVAARIALEKLGTAAGAGVGRGEAGEPLWPHGMSGSITHCGPWSVAAATESSDGVFLGIDLEDTNRIQSFGIENLVCRPAEREWLHEDNNALERLCMIFSAKEALYKSLFLTYRRYIDFAEVEVRWCPEARGFRVLVLPYYKRSQARVSLISSRRCNNLIFSCAAYARQ